MYSYKCLGGATLYSVVTNYTTCNGPARIHQSTSNYSINGIHFMHADFDELISASMPSNVDDGAIHEIVLQQDSLINDFIINDAEPLNDFSVYPNPAQNQIKISFQQVQDNSTLQIVNLAGQIQYQINLNSIHSYTSQFLNIADFPNGEYLINVIKTNVCSSKKLIVLH
jgi:hypothetical protein